MGARRPLSQETRDKIAAKARERMADPAARAAHSAKLRGRKATPEQRAKNAAAQRGRKHSPETIEKMRAAALAVWQRAGNEARRERVRKLPRKGRPKGMRHTPEARAKMSVSHKGKSNSEAQKRAVAESNRRRGAARRGETTWPTSPT